MYQFGKLVVAMMYIIAGSRSSEVTVKFSSLPGPPLPESKSVHFCKQDSLAAGVVDSSTFNNSFLAFGIILPNSALTPKSSNFRDDESFLHQKLITISLRMYSS